MNWPRNEDEDMRYKTLQSMQKLRKYNDWIFEKIHPFLGKRILEVGAGIGNITQYLLNRELVVATDINKNYLTYLRNLFGHCWNVEIHPLDLNQMDIIAFKQYSFDTVVCLNVLEHVEHDDDALRNLHEVLSSGGRLVLLVPSLKILYGTLDKRLGHFRRYSRSEVQSKFVRAGFQIEKLCYFSLLSSVGWFVNSCILKRKRLPPFQLKIANFLVPVMKLEERFDLPFGMSIIAVGIKE